MNSTVNAYNRIAWIYDPISRWCLGKKYTQSKYIYLDRLQCGSKVLILGGGTGENLPEIVQRIGDQGTVCFMEASTAMIRKAKKRFLGEIPGNIQFIHSADFSLLSPIEPDTILTQYVLDTLSNDQLEGLFGKLNGKARIDTEWIFVDFYAVPEKRWLIRILIGLFRIVVNHPRKDLPDYACFFDRWGWKEKVSCSFLEGFIQSKVYSRD